MNADELAREVQEAGNLLGTFLCTGALARLRKQGSAGELNALVARTLDRYAPAFRAMHELAEAAPDVEPALERLDVVTRLGISFDAAGEVAELRGAIRELLASAGFELPPPPARERSVCELHGAACPLLASGGSRSTPPPRRAAAAKTSASTGRKKAARKREPGRGRRGSKP